MHALGFPIWAAIRGDAACVILLEMNGAGIAHEGLYVTSLVDAAIAWRRRADEFADTLKIASIFSKYTLGRYGGHYYAKAQNLRRRLRAAYDAVLGSHDLLLMPTVPMKATPIPGKGATAQEITRRSWEATRNTCPFNVTGHPAISLPCGMGDGRPIGMMLVGRHSAEEMIYRAAAAFERLDEILRAKSMIPKSGNRFSEKDHAQTKSQSGMIISKKNHPALGSRGAPRAEDEVFHEFEQGVERQLDRGREQKKK